jgi:hypothetical protein
MNTREDLNVDTFTDWLNSLDETPCESAHTAPGCLTCSGPTVARKVRCAGGFNICAVSAEWNRGVIERREIRCFWCGKNVADCWRIVPI